MNVVCLFTVVVCNMGLVQNFHIQTIGLSVDVYFCENLGQRFFLLSC